MKEKYTIRPKSGINEVEFVYSLSDKNFSYSFAV